MSSEGRYGRPALFAVIASPSCRSCEIEWICLTGAHFHLDPAVSGSCFSFSGQVGSFGSWCSSYSTSCSPCRSWATLDWISRYLLVSWTCRRTRSHLGTLWRPASMASFIDVVLSPSLSVSPCFSGFWVYPATSVRLACWNCWYISGFRRSVV